MAERKPVQLYYSIIRTHTHHATVRRCALNVKKVSKASQESGGREGGNSPPVDAVLHIGTDPRALALAAVPAAKIHRLHAPVTVRLQNHIR